MMNVDIASDNDDDEEDTILDQQRLLQNTNKGQNSASFSLNELNIGVYDDANQLSKKKSIILAVTCISIGMFTGLLGPTLPYLAQKLSTNLSSVAWLVCVKAIGFLVGTCLSSHFYTWFNVCCMLGLSCLSISFGVGSLPFITDTTTFYLTSFILGIGLSLSYNGIDALYNRLWTRSSVSSIRWLHLLVALGAIFSTFMLLLPTFLNSNNNSEFMTNNTQIIRPRRAINDNRSLILNLSTAKTTIKVQPGTRENLTESFYTKSSTALEQTSSKLICTTFYCCYNQMNLFTCEDSNSDQSNDCKHIFSVCRNSILNPCHIEKLDMWCQMNKVCAADGKPNCSSNLINMTMSTSQFISTTTTTQMSTTYHSKPSMAESDNDDLSQNFFYEKIRSFLQSVTLIDSCYLLIAFVFFLLGLFHSIFAMHYDKTNVISMKNLNPLALLFMQPHRVIHNPNKPISLLADRSSFRFVFLLVLFYFILSGIENSCTYFTYILGRKFQYSERTSLAFQFCFLFGRLLDILFNYIWFLLHKCFKRQSDFISIKLFIFIRLTLLTTIAFLNVFQQMYYLLFFSIGLLLTSLSSLILYWIERDLSLSELLVRIILFTILISEIFLPIFIFYKIEYFLQFYLLVGLCSMIVLFMLVLYASRKWQRNRLYRLLPMSMSVDEVELGEISDNETSTMARRTQ